MDLTPVEVKAIQQRLCGDREETERIARRFLALQQKYRKMTLPEGILYAWLEKRRLNFVYQAEAFGGRAQYGGQVPDFWLPELGVAINVNGDYWHGSLLRSRRDAENKIRLMGSKIEGVRVTAVVDLWESTLYSCRREMAMRLAAQGVEVGK